MKKLAVLILILSALAMSCRRRTTPNRVNAFLSQGGWVIGKIRDSGAIRTHQYDLYRFDFKEFKELTVEYNYSDTFNCSWEVPEKEKNPAQLILRFPENDSLLQILHDDWYVTYLNKDEFHLVRLDGSKDSNDIVIFARP